MKFLLVALNAKYIHSNPAVYSLRSYVGEALQKHVEIAEYTINHSFGEVLADIYKRKPDVIGFSCYIWNIHMVLELIPEVSKLLPEVPIWLGGPEVSFDATQLLAKYPMVTGVMIGEGEETFRELLEYYTQGQDGSLQGISGLCLPEGYTAPRELTDISTLPFLYQDLENFQNRIIYYESSRGCPFRCSYCLSSIEKKVRLRDLEIVKQELQFFLNHKVKQVKFVDRTFNCNHVHAMEIWQYLLEHDNGVTNFHFEIAADILKDAEIELLGKLRPGLVQLEIGVQSTNPRTLEAIHRSMSVEKLEEIVATIHAGRNVHQHLDLIAGLPFEDYDSFGASFNRVYAMAPQQLQLGFLKVLKGSEMHERAEEFGIHYLDKPPYEVLFTNWLSYEDVLKLKRVEEMVELYYNSNQFRHTIRFLEGVFETPFRMYEALADFYERKGYFVNSPARSYRYQVLLEFALEYDEAWVEAYGELLTYDMYLRENLKSRPDFAKDLLEYKEEIRSFYRKEEESRRYLPAYGDYDSRQLARMTHLEPFFYPVWNMPNRRERKELPQSVKGNQPVYVLFDYQERNPLNEDAWTVQIRV
ncbi:MAG: B12-binding domain-containing radical SAM protein [Lachnospiraceae bacterium]|nr:B12-binding domain-containing radical SAM protein [Lachnospiraceae bacterium]